MNDQFPKEIAERRKVLYPSFKENRLKRERIALVIDKLYVHYQIREPKTTGYFKNYKVFIEETNKETHNSSLVMDCNNTTTKKHVFIINYNSLEHKNTNSTWWRTQ
jgi:hypothetical protein